MKKIGIFYAAKADKTSWVAEKIQNAFGTSAESVAIENAWQNDFEAYDNFIVGASTWFDGELPTYWDELLPELRTLQLKGKKVAIFGLGDQVKRCGMPCLRAKAWPVSLLREQTAVASKRNSSRAASRIQSGIKLVPIIPKRTFLIL